LIKRPTLGVIAIAIACTSACKRKDITVTPSPSDASPTGSSDPRRAMAAAENAVPLPASSVAGLVNPGNLPPYRGPVGSVEGMVTIRGESPPDVASADFEKCPAVREMYKKLFRQGPAVADGAHTLADAIVTISGYSGFYLPETREVRRVSIDTCAFDTRTIDMTIGQRLEITNSSDTPYAPELQEAPLLTPAIAAPKGAPVSLYPRQARRCTLIDRLGAGSMKADIHVRLDPLHTVTSVDGRYRIDGVPVGRVWVTVRLPAIDQEKTLPANVRANLAESVDVQLSYSATPRRGLGK
jgi:hypothetical protein